MKKRFLFVLVSLLILMTGCNQQQGQIKEKASNTTKNMADSESLQKAFSTGRIRVMQNDLQTKRTILQNTIHEQKMMIKDPKISQQLLKLNVHINQMMIESSSGKEQLTQSTLKVLNGINNDLNKLRSLMLIQTDSRREAVKDHQLRNQILLQNMKEQYLALENASTSKDAKVLSLKTTNAVQNDNELKTTLLRQNIRAFGDISASPVLRSEMANAMLLLLKDPKISKEMEKMMKLLLAKEMPKLQAKMLKMQKMQQQKLQQKKMSPTNHNSSKKNNSGSGSTNFDNNRTKPSS